jgi:hypothetical protein
MRIAALLLTLTTLPVLAASATATHADKAAQTRAATGLEKAEFAQFYRDTHAGVGAAAPAFSVTRAVGARDWRVSATLDGAAVAGAAPLCRMTRSRYQYDPAAPKERRWSAAAPDQFVWLGSGAACVLPSWPVRLEQPLTDAGLLPLLKQQATLLGRARLLMAGNSDCALERSSPFALMAIAAPPAAAGKAPMRGLRFESDRGSVAQVWVRVGARNTDLTAWNVSCPKSK